MAQDISIPQAIEMIKKYSGKLILQTPNVEDYFIIYKGMIITVSINRIKHTATIGE